MQPVKRPQQVNTKSKHFQEDYPSQNTSQHSNTSRVDQQKYKRFKRNKPHNQNHSKSSSNCSESKSISKFYIKNIVNLIPAEIIQNQCEEKNIPSKDFERKEVKSPRSSIRNALNAYGLGRDVNQKSPIKERKQEKKKNSGIDISNFLRRQFSPPAQKNDIPHRKNIRNGINLIEDSYNFFSPISKRANDLVEDSKNKESKYLLQQLTKQRNRNAELTLELEKSKNNQKKLHLLNEQLEMKGKRLTEKINALQQDLNKSVMNSAKLKEENHRMKVLVKQRDSLMTTLMEKDKVLIGKKEGSHIKSPQQQNESLVSKVIEYEYENQKLRDTIYKLKKQLEEKEYNPSSSRMLSVGQIPSHLQKQQSIMSSQITWEDQQFTDCLQQKDKEILQLREEIKNLHIEINYINRKWINEVERVKKIDKLEWMKLKDKYKDLLIKYKEKIKMNIVLPPSKDQLNRIWKENKKLNILPPTHEQQNLTLNPESPRMRKRNYTIDHLKGRGVMSDIKINYGVTKTGNPQDTTDLELLQYSSCDEDIAT